MDLFTEEYRILNLRSTSLATMFISYLICTAYSLQIYAGDLGKTIFSLVTIGLFFKGVTQIGVSIGGRHKVYKILAFYEEFYTRALELELESTLYRFSDYMEKFLMLIQILYAGAVSAALLNPFMMKLLTGNLVLVFGFEIPLLDPFSTKGFALNYILAVYIALNGLVGFAAADGLIMFIIMPIYLMAECLINLINDLESHAEVENNDIENIQIIRNEKLKTIVEIHKVMNQSIVLVEDFLVMSNLICISTIVLTCVASLFALIKAGWYLGITFAVVAVFQIFVYCIFGTVLEIVQERFRGKVVKINWIDKSECEKKHLLFILTATVKSANFTCLISKLNLDTFMSVKFINL